MAEKVKKIKIPHSRVNTGRLHSFLDWLSWPMFFFTNSIGKKSRVEGSVGWLPSNYSDAYSNISMFSVKIMFVISVGS